MGRLFRDIRERLTALYGRGEAQAMALMLIEETAQLTSADILMNRDDELSAADLERLERYAERLERGEPIQYVIGVARFCGMDVRVSPDVLIPRPETEELVVTVGNLQPKRILDVGTGSGCIALALKRTYPDAQVVAFDISEKSLDIAAENAWRLKLDIIFEKKNILTCQAGTEQWDLIVSNPPYICNCEKADMESNVLDYEPHLALFVPDDDPLRFYHAISRYAQKTLTNGGTLAFEINRKYANEVAETMVRHGLTAIDVVKDSFGNDRIVTGRKE